MFRLVEKENIKYFISDIFPSNVIHAFTTRNGGFAPAPLDNFSLGTGQYKQYKDYIINNRKLLCNSLDIDYNKLAMTDQQHTDNIVILDNSSDASLNRYLKNTDAIITANRNLPALLFFADCTPIILYDTQKKVLGLIHAGWKGTVKRITVKTIEKLMNVYNSDPQDIVAAIGPNISMCCFEVDKEVADQLEKCIPKTSINEKIINYKNNKAYVDLKQINAIQLRSLGVNNIDISQECTCCRTDLFFSHRLTKGHTGRQGLISQLI